MYQGFCTLSALRNLSSSQAQLQTVVSKFLNTNPKYTEPMQCIAKTLGYLLIHSMNFVWARVRLQSVPLHSFLYNSCSRKESLDIKDCYN